jgi:hypothetical protein
LIENTTTITNHRPRGSLHALQESHRSRWLATTARLKCSYSYANPSPRVHWIAIVVTTQAGNYLSSKDRTGRMVVSIRRDVYTYSRARGKKPYPGFDPAIPNLEDVGHMRCAFVSNVEGSSHRFKGYLCIGLFRGDTMCLGSRRFVVVFFTACGLVLKRRLWRLSSPRYEDGPSSMTMLLDVL